MTPEDLKRIRAQLEKTQKELASDLCVSDSLFQKLEQGKRKIRRPYIQILLGMLKK